MHRPVGYYGKLPSRGDFIGRRFRPDTIRAWDGWLQAALSGSQALLDPHWRELYFVAPFWRFLLPPGLCGTSALVGVMMPSIDKVQRCFPLMLGLELAPDEAEAVAAGGGAWFQQLEDRGLAALEANFDLAALDQSLALTAGPGSLATPIDGPARWFPAASPRTMRPAGSLWWTTGSPQIEAGLAALDGMPGPAQFAALLDGQWAAHGWQVEPIAALDWDREEA